MAIFDWLLYQIQKISYFKYGVSSMIIKKSADTYKRLVSQTQTCPYEQNNESEENVYVY